MAVSSTVAMATVAMAAVAMAAVAVAAVAEGVSPTGTPFIRVSRWAELPM